MGNVFNTAEYIVHLCGPVSAVRLQALCYYAQGWSLAWTGKPLFPEQFYAVETGAFCPELEAALKGCPLFLTDGTFSKGLPDRKHPLTPDEKDTVRRVVKYYTRYGNHQALQGWISEEEPWKKAREKQESSAASLPVITKKSMGKYYRSVLESA